MQIALNVHVILNVFNFFYTRISVVLYLYWEEHIWTAGSTDEQYNSAVHAHSNIKPVKL